MSKSRKILLSAPSDWNYEGSSNSKFGELPISKMLKHELQLQLSMCQKYLELKSFYLDSTWQPDFLFGTFSENHTFQVNSRIDALSMALALKNKKRPRVKIAELCEVLSEAPSDKHFVPIKPEVTDCCCAGDTEIFACANENCNTCNSCIDKSLL